MTRRKPLAARQPNGQIRRQPEPIPPTELKRMRDAAALMRHPEWATTLGWLAQTCKITEAQYTAGTRWSRLLEEYSAAMQSPKIPRSAKLEPGGGITPDPNSPRGLREARQHAQTIQAYLDASEVLKRTGTPVRLAMRHVCELNTMVSGQDELMALRRGLDVLAAWWSGTRRPK